MVMLVPSSCSTCPPPPQDLGSKDLKRERLFLVCQIIRVGRMDRRDTYSRKLSMGLRRPFGISGESSLCCGCWDPPDAACASTPQYLPLAMAPWGSLAMGCSGSGQQCPRAAPAGRGSPIPTCGP